MAWKKSARAKTAKTRPARKVGYRKAKAVVAKANRKMAKKNLDTFYLRAKLQGVLVPQQGATVSNYIYYTQPIMNSANITDFTRNAEFQLYALQYDRFRVNSVTVRIIPKANVLDQVNAQDDNNRGGLLGDGLVHVVHDRDGNGPNNITKLSRYPSYRKYSVLKKWSSTYKVTYPKGMWLDCQNPTDAKQPFGEMAGLNGTITMYAENLIEDWGEISNEPWATMVIEYGIVFQGKSQPNLTYAVDENGNVTSVTMTPLTVGEAKDITPLSAVQGSITDAVYTDTLDVGTGPQVIPTVNVSSFQTLVDQVSTLIG